MTEVTHVLELPIERQKKLADYMGLTHSAWVLEMKSSDAKFKEADKEPETAPSNLTQEEIARFQKKMDDPGWSGSVSVINI
jgi:hypothetical protein